MHGTLTRMFHVRQEHSELLTRITFYDKPVVTVFFLFSIMILGIAPFSMNPVHADEPAVTTLDPILVTGSAHPTRLHRTTQSHTIITKKQYTPLQPNRLSNLLQQVPGIHLDEMAGHCFVSTQNSTTFLTKRSKLL